MPSPYSSSDSSPRFGEVCEIHLGNEAPADASVVAVLQQHPFLPAVCLVAFSPVSAHPQVKLHKLRPFGVQVPAQQLPQPSLTTAQTSQSWKSDPQEAAEHTPTLLKAGVNVCATSRDSCFLVTAATITSPALWNQLEI